MTMVAGSMVPSGSESFPVTEKVTAVSSAVLAESSAATGPCRSVMLIMQMLNQIIQMFATVMISKLRLVIGLHTLLLEQ